MNRINLDDMIDNYGDIFDVDEVIYPMKDGKYIELTFFDRDEPKSYFDVWAKWHPRKRDFEYDLTVFNKQINAALLKMKQNKLKRKLKQIKKDF